MRARGLFGLLLLVVAWSHAADFGAEPPYPIARLATFEVLAGELESSRLRAAYRFYVDPLRPGLYTVMRYRLRSSGNEPPPTEKLVWNERPGQPAPLRCFEWIVAGGGGEGGGWRELSAASAAYGQEMQTLRLVLFEQNRDYRNRLERDGGR
jgi:hypothetical protein